MNNKEHMRPSSRSCSTAKDKYETKETQSQFSYFSPREAAGGGVLQKTKSQTTPLWAGMPIEVRVPKSGSPHTP